MKKNFIQWFWFIGGFAVGFSLISLSHASLQSKAVAVSESRTSIGTQQLDQEYSRLSAAESRYVESTDQQKKLKAVTLRNARRLKN